MKYFSCKILAVSFFIAVSTTQMFAQFNIYQNPTRAAIGDASNQFMGGIGDFTSILYPKRSWHLYSAESNPPSILRIQKADPIPTDLSSWGQMGIEFHSGTIDDNIEWRPAFIRPVVYSTSTPLFGHQGGLSFTTNLRDNRGLATGNTAAGLIANQTEMVRMTAEGTGILLPATQTSPPLDALQIGDKFVTHIGANHHFFGFNQFWGGTNLPTRILNTSQSSMAIIFRNEWNALELLNTGIGNGAVNWDEADGGVKGISIGNNNVDVNNNGDRALIGIGSR